MPSVIGRYVPSGSDSVTSARAVMIYRFADGMDGVYPYSVEEDAGNWTILTSRQYEMVEFMRALEGVIPNGVQAVIEEYGPNPNDRPNGMIVRFRMPLNQVTEPLMTDGLDGSVGISRSPGLPYTTAGHYRVVELPLKSEPKAPAVEAPMDWADLL